jgi:putative transcriptional regulator
VTRTQAKLPRPHPTHPNQVRELRTERGLSQGQLATGMNVSRQTINSIEQERYTPSLPLALALARFFDTSVEVMFDGDQ